MVSIPAFLLLSSPVSIEHADVDRLCLFKKIASSCARIRLVHDMTSGSCAASVNSCFTLLPPTITTSDTTIQEATKKCQNYKKVKGFNMFQLRSIGLWPWLVQVLGDPRGGQGRVCRCRCGHLPPPQREVGHHQAGATAASLSRALQRRWRQSSS